MNEDRQIYELRPWGTYYSELWIEMRRLSLYASVSLPSMVELMACRLVGTKPLSKPTLGYCQLDTEGQIPVNFQSKYTTFHSRKCICKISSAKWRPFCLGLDVLNTLPLCIVMNQPSQRHASFVTSVVVPPTHLSLVCTLTLYVLNFSEGT